MRLRGWTNLAIFALCAAIGTSRAVTTGGWWLLRSFVVAFFVIVAVRCVLVAARLTVYAEVTWAMREVAKRRETTP